MIAEHQPTIFPPSVIAKVSSVANGRMPTAIVPTDPEQDLAANREQFLAAVGIHPDHATQIRVTFDADHYRRYRVADVNAKGEGIGLAPGEPADAMVVTDTNHALVLPLADCVGAIVYDPTKRVLMVSHLGRHSTEEHGAVHSVRFMQTAHDCNPANILVWISPAVGAASYPLQKFDERGLQEVNLEQFLEAGITPEHIEVAEVDTASHDDYYSHSQFLKGNDAKRGRFAIVAMMLEQGEPA
ncbi:MAG TPA: laccase domain-containing protein [Candidatus Saccharimonadales bacterium]